MCSCLNVGCIFLYNDHDLLALTVLEDFFDLNGDKFQLRWLLLLVLVRLPVLVLVLGFRLCSRANGNCQ